MLSLEREAQRDCGKLCWICVDGKVVQVTESRRKQEAPNATSRKKKRSGIAKLWWVCVDGRVVQVTGRKARQRPNVTRPRKKRRGIAGQTLLGLRRRTGRARCLRRRPRRKAFRVILPGNERRRLVANFAGSALTERSFRCPRQRPRRKAFPVILPESERRRLAGETLLGLRRRTGGADSRGRGQGERHSLLSFQRRAQRPVENCVGSALTEGRADDGGGGQGERPSMLSFQRASAGDVRETLLGLRGRTGRADA